MEESKGVVKHVLLAKFKDGIPPDEIDLLIKGYARLVDHIEPMKSFYMNCLDPTIAATWSCLDTSHGYMGNDVSIENLHQGFTHIFESTFESTEGIAEYIAHPAHVDFSNLLLPQLEKVLVIDYKPTIVKL